MNDPTTPGHGRRSRDPRLTGDALSSALAERLHRSLDEQATLVPLTDTPIADVVRRGHQRRQRRATTVGVLATAAIVSTVVVGINVLSADRPHRLVSGNDVGDPSGEMAENPDIPANATADAPESITAQGSTAAASPDVIGSITPVPSNLTWTSVTPDAAKALAYPNIVAGGSSAGGPLLAYATAPGESDDGSPVIYVSDDGVGWVAVNGPSARSGDWHAMTGDGTRLYSVGTAAGEATTVRNATDLVLDMSVDGGTTWDHVVLGTELAEIAALDGVRSVGTSAAQIAAGPRGVVVAYRPAISFDIDLDAVTDRGSRVYTFTRAGVVVYPSSCGTVDRTAATSTTSIVSGPLGDDAASELPVAAEVEPAGPISATTIHIGGAGRADAMVWPPPPDCAIAADEPATLHPWTDLGVAPAAVDALFAPPTILASTDGRSFARVDLPLAGDRARVDLDRLVSLGDGFALVVSETSDDGSSLGQRLFLSSDTVTWTEHGMPPRAPASILSMGRLAGGELAIAFIGYGPSKQTTTVVVAVSPDEGATWTETDLAGLLTPADGQTAALQAFGTVVGPTGITIGGNVAIDPFVEHGPFSVTVDGVLVTQLDQWGTTVFADAATNEELGRLGPYVFDSDGTLDDDGSVNAARDPATGDMVLLAADGSVRARFTYDDVAAMSERAYATQPVAIVLHSDDGVGWSRQQVSDLTGSSTAFPSGLAATATQVVLTVIDRTELNDIAKPTTKVLIGTPTR